jgi:hypothetical protein
MFKSDDHKTDLGLPRYKAASQEIVRLYGTKNEIERFEAGVLPDHEFEEIVSDVLFEPILDMPIRKKITDKAVRQIAVRRGKATWEDAVTFEMLDAADSLTAEQGEILKEIKEKLPKADIKPFHVVAVCGTYEQRHTAASVEIKLGDRYRRIDVYLDRAYSKERV